MMRNCLSPLAISALLIASALSAASAADLPVKGAPYAPAPAPVVSWTGYIGGNGGEAWSQKNVTLTGFESEATNSPLGPASGTGGALGVQAGCDYRI